MWLFHRQSSVWQPPPCICEQVERHVREAIAMRDEMAHWKTPLEEWLALQTMPVLTLKSEPTPKPIEAVWATKYIETFNCRGTRVSSMTGGVFTHSGTSESGYAHQMLRGFDLEPSFSMAILPSDGNVIAGSILERGNGWYKVLSVSGDRMTAQRYY